MGNCLTLLFWVVREEKGDVGGSDHKSNHIVWTFYSEFNFFFIIVVQNYHANTNCIPHFLPCHQLHHLHVHLLLHTCVYFLFVEFHSQQQSSLHVALSLFCSTGEQFSECLLNYALCRRSMCIMGMNSEEIMHFTYVQLLHVLDLLRNGIGDWFINHVIMLFLQLFIIVLICCTINVR